ncbi:Holliday junction resolvase RuvX [Demequina sp.]|uniref:Holliday junction resolvase RuvX n=1 Tax=Demequina sp. TaxID=2050685 RepID=UPI003D0BFFCE
MDAGVRLGVDVGSVRIGVAASDPDGIMAFPVETVTTGEGDAERVAAIASDRNAIAIFIGLPKTLRGGEGTSAAMAEEFARRVAELTSADVRLIDERFSTTTASRALTGAGRSAKKQRQVIDQAAAVVILESALDVDRRGNLGIVTKRIPHEGNND